MATRISRRLQRDFFETQTRLFSLAAVRQKLTADGAAPITPDGFTRLRRWQDILQDPARRSDIGEAQNRADFVRDIFEVLLGYKTVGTSDIYHLKWERAGTSDSRTADNLLGVFGRDEEERTRGVVELKSPGIDLDKRSQRKDRLSAVDQAFLYANKFDGIRWVIVTNFEEIRLYNHRRGATVYEQFWTRELIAEELKRFIFLLRRENLIGDGQAKSTTEKLAEKTWHEQAEISKRFYEEYQGARIELFGELRRQNPDHEPLDILEATQLLLDRLLFVMFCADRGLLPADIVKEISWQGDRKNVARGPESLWNAVLRLFDAINRGNADAGISGYNGGLFAPSLVDELKLHHEDFSSPFVLKRLLLWDNFDFESQLDVEVLGHIFENSVSDLEELRREIVDDPSKIGLAWRNREGIFYTPDWVTRYIVDRTVGRYLDEHPDVGPDIRVLDPACGSGAFLIQLIPIFQERIRQLAPEESAEVEAAWNGEVDLFHDPALLEPKALYAAIRRSVYGVDRSPESIEISKLSFWLKTVMRGHPLPPLEDNLQVGNSLCRNSALVADAFDWKVRLPDFADGAHAVVGNPPWVTEPPEYAKCLPEEFELAGGWYDLAFLFMELALDQLREGGYLGFIVPDSLLINSETEDVRRLLAERNTLREVIKLGEGVFPGVFRASAIVIVQKGRPPAGHTFEGMIVTKADRKQITDVTTNANLDVLMAERGSSIRLDRILRNPQAEFDLFLGEHDENLITTIEQNQIQWPAIVQRGRGVELNSSGHAVRCPNCFLWDAPPSKKKGIYKPKVCAHCGSEYNMENALEEAHLINEVGESNEADTPFIDGTDVNRYRIEGSRNIVTGKEGINYKSPDLYNSPKIVFRQAGIGITATIDYDLNAYAPQSVYIFRLRDDREGDAARYRLEYVLGVLNSRVMLYYYFKKTGQIEWQSYPRWTLARVTDLPVREIDWGNQEEVALHNAIADKVESLIRSGRAGEPDADLEIEQDVMDLYGLDSEDRQRVWATLKSVHELKVIREVLPSTQVDLAI